MVVMRVSNSRHALRTVQYALYVLSSSATWSRIASAVASVLEPSHAIALRTASRTLSCGSTAVALATDSREAAETETKGGARSEAID